MTDTVWKQMRAIYFVRVILEQYRPYVAFNIDADYTVFPSRLSNEGSPEEVGGRLL